jgi:diguanylate cyclase (GGDEF)-like protein/putative nucleotidyltransferase with HDIG domain
LERRAQPWTALPWRARLFIGWIGTGGVLVLSYGLVHWVSHDPAQFVSYLAIAVIASRLKVKLPGIPGTMSVNFLFILLGLVEMGLGETLAIACAATLAQCLFADRPRSFQVIFNICSVTIATAIAYGAYHWTLRGMPQAGISIPLLAAASAFFFANTLPVALVISLTEEKAIQSLWSDFYFWTFPYYMVDAGIATLVGWLNRRMPWETSLLVLPVVYVVYRSYRLYLGRLAAEKQHVEEVAGLHMRTIEALALAIEAKDHTTHAHLQRVRIYAVELAKRLNLPQEEIEAIQAAALLHDIGKLAVPEHIISKPGKLTPEEFEKIKIHPVVGAEILERVNFPYPVVPIVRAHHEKWDGSGYPAGLKGEEIPIGARILSAVDFLDAMASDRQYRKALEMTDVMVRLREESGKSFDPHVVEVLCANCAELEARVLMQAPAADYDGLPLRVKVEKGVTPTSGSESTSIKETPPRQEAGFLFSIAAARQEAQTLFELSHELGASLSLDETLSVLAVKLKRLVPYDSIAVYVCQDEHLRPQYVSGDNFRLFSSLRIPLGEGVSGWVAQKGKPLINGNPSVEPGYLDDPTKFSTLRSALSVPLEGLKGVIGALTLYRAEQDAFDTDNLRILLAISSKTALSLENAMKYEQAESSATTDYLTGLPNARSLFLHLDQELARCKRSESTATVMVTDLDGFKQVNDRWGHLEGNRVLRLFAERLKDVCREYDYVARMSGDEFVLVLPGLSPDAALARTGQLMNLAKAVGQEVTGEDILSLSVGQSSYPGDGLDAEQLLAEADRRMYMVKQNHHQEAGLARGAGSPST